jgi:hypothetical protein
MSLLIQDNEWTIDANGVQQVKTGHRPVVRAQSLAVPVLQRPPTSGPYVEDESEVRTATVGGGQWSLVLPWPSETRSGTSTWSITRMNGTVVQGSVPEGITGPLSIDDLLFALSGLARAVGLPPFANWAISPGQVPAQPVVVQTVGPIPRGVWAVDVPYLPGDLVTTADGLIFIALVASEGVAPPSFAVSSATWGLWAMNTPEALFAGLVFVNDPNDPDYVLFPDGEFLAYA